MFAEASAEMRYTLETRTHRDHGDRTRNMGGTIEKASRLFKPFATEQCADCGA